jgi:hypothetical protein
MGMIFSAQHNAIAGQAMALEKSSSESGRDQDREIRSSLLDRLVQRGARFSFATTAAIGTAGTRLQLGEAAYSVGSRAADVVIGNGIAEADVHGAHFQRECE